jgi:dihydropteroate synthase
MTALALPTRPLVMGVLNVTPDSFSDGGRWFEPAAAIAHGRELIAEGADVVDVGGESTRPGAEPVSEAEELRRVVPVVAALAPEVRVSIDTVKPAVARAAVAAGATLINDVSASLYEVAAETGAGWVAMHMRGTPATMQSRADYADVVAEVRDHLAERAARADAAGVAEIWLDPGIGFAKTADHNLALLRRLDELVALGRPVVVGTSRKSFLGALTARSDATAAGRDRRGNPGLRGPNAEAGLRGPNAEAGRRGPNAEAGLRGPNAEAGLRGPNAEARPPAPPDDRLEASVATATWAMAAGVHMVRAHDVRATVQAARVVGPWAARPAAERQEGTT